MNELESLIKKAASEASLATVLEMRDLSNISELVKSAGWDAIPKMWNAAKGMWGATKGWMKANPRKSFPTVAGASLLTGAGTTALAMSGDDDEERDTAVRQSQEEERKAEAAKKQKKSNTDFWDTVNKYKYTGIGGLLGGSLGLGLSGESTSSKVLAALLGTALGGGAGWALDTYLK